MGLELIGCPSSPAPPAAGSGTPQPTPKGSSLAEPPPAELQPAEPQPALEEIPWQDTEGVAGGMRAPIDYPTALAVGGGPVSVVFKDGRKATIVVAVVLPGLLEISTPKLFAARAKEHADLIRAVARLHPYTALAGGGALSSFEQALERKLATAVPGSIQIQGVSAAETISVGATRKHRLKSASSAEGRRGALMEAPARAPSRRAPSDASAKGLGASEGDAMDSAAGLAPAAPAKPMVRRLWLPCRKPGCSTCKS